MHLSFELIHIFHLWNVPFGSETSGDDQESCLGGAAICCLDGPFSIILVEFAGGNDGLKGRVFAEIADFVDVVKISLKFAPVGVVGSEGPCVVHFWNVELVDRGFAVDSSSRITVPSPMISNEYRFSMQKMVWLKC